jgi:hypothetical protein
VVTKGRNVQEIFSCDWTNGKITSRVLMVTMIMKCKGLKRRQQTINLRPFMDKTGHLGNSRMKLDSMASFATEEHELLKYALTACFAKCTIVESPNSFNQSTFLINSLGLTWYPFVKNNWIIKVLHS